MPYIKTVVAAICSTILISANEASGQSNPLTSFQTISPDHSTRQWDGMNAWFIRGDNNMKLGQFEAAIMAYDNAVAQNPFFAEAYIKRALAKKRLGRNAEAEVDYKTALRFNPFIGQLYGYTDRLAQLNILAFDPYGQSLPISQETQLNYFFNYYGIADIAAEDLEENLNALAWVSDNPQENAGLLVEQSLILWRMDDKVAAVEKLEEAIAQNQQERNAYFLLGLIALHQQDMPEAQHWIQNAEALFPNDALTFYYSALMDHYNYRLKEALQKLNQSIELQPDLGKAYFERAMVHKALGDSEASIDDYNIAMNYLQLDEAIFCHNQSIAQKMSGNVQEALNDINCALEMNADDPSAYKIRGNLHVLLGDYLQAEMDYSNAIALKPDFAEAYFNRGIARLMLYNRPDACQDMQQSINLGYSSALNPWQYLCAY